MSTHPIDKHGKATTERRSTPSANGGAKIAGRGDVEVLVLVLVDVLVLVNVLVLVCVVDVAVVDDVVTVYVVEDCVVVVVVVVDNVVVVVVVIGHSPSPARQSTGPLHILPLASGSIRTT